MSFDSDSFEASLDVNQDVSYPVPFTPAPIAYPFPPQTANNLLAPVTPLCLTTSYLPPESSLLEAMSVEDDFLGVEGIGDLGFDDDHFSQNRPGDYFSMHISDL
jgi:hypothetical protein